MIRRISKGIITLVAGSGTAGLSAGNGSSTGEELAWPDGVTVAPSGSIYITDTLNNLVRLLVPVSVAGAAGGGTNIQLGFPAGFAWTATSNDSWITITSGASGTGSGTVSLALDANNSGAQRDGTITIAGQNYTIVQAANSTTGLSLAGSMAQIASGGGWETTLTLVNMSSTPGTALLNFYADDGTTPLLPFTAPQQPSVGTVLSASFDEALNPSALVVLDTTSSSGTPVVGSSQLLNSGGIDGYAIFKFTLTGQEAAVPLETRNAGSYVLAFDNTGSLATGVAIANVADSAASVGVIIRDDTGAQIGTGSVRLAALGHTSFMLTDPTVGFPITAGKRGTVEFDTPSGGQISVLGIRGNGAALTSLPPLASAGTTGGAMAQVASGGGWQTIFTLVNTGTSAANATLNFYDDNGNPLSLPLSFPQTGSVATESTVTQSIPAGATLIVTTMGTLTGDSTVGSAQLTTNGNVSGFAIFQYSAGTNAITLDQGFADRIQEAVVPLETGTVTSYTLAFDNTNSLATGVALANASAQAANIPVTLRDDTGATLGTTTVTLPANGHNSLMLTDLFPAAGTFSVRSSSIRHRAGKSAW